MKPENNINDIELPEKHTITVLLIDDQQMVGEVVKRMLENQKDIRFFFCSEPEQAIQTAIEVEPTVILQDLIMPDIDGLTLVRYFRAEPKTRDIPLIVLSSEEDAKTKAEAFALGANDYLIKLPDYVELLARIRYHSRGYIHMLQRNEAFNAMQKAQQLLAEELNEAADYVFSLLPQPLQGEVTVDWKFIPSTSLGGDSFGYHWLDRDNFAVYLLDVAGHGVGAALLSVSASEVLRSQTLSDTDFHDPAKVLTQLNNAFKMHEHNHKFFTIWYGVYNRPRRELTYATGGHPPAIMINGASYDNIEILQLRTPGTMIGAMEGSKYQNAVVKVDAFNRLYIYSDGTFEIVMPDNSMWSFHDFAELLSTPEDGDYPGLESIFEKVTALKGTPGFDDDFSLLRISFDSLHDGEVEVQPRCSYQMEQADL